MELEEQRLVHDTKAKMKGKKNKKTEYVSDAPKSKRARKK